MNISISLKLFLAKLFFISGFVDVCIGKYSKNEYLILMYHRIIPFKEAEKGLQAGMYVEPETFDMHIQYLKNHFHIIPITEITSVIKNSSTKSRNKPICILTFDDGWYDFYKYAYPILATQRVPATVFLPTEFVGKENCFWTDQLTKLFVERERKKEPIVVDSNSCIDIVKKLLDLKGSLDTRIENAISILKKHPDDQINNVIMELKNIWQLNTNLKSRSFLTWDEVEKMASSGIITFGSHTVSHKILNYLNEEDIMEELVTSKKVLIEKGVVSPLFIPFCYPNGNCNDKIISMVKNAGYHMAVTTERGWNQTTTSLFSLRRVGMHQDVSSTKEMFGCRIAKLF